jgi:hypothetical protein
MTPKLTDEMREALGRQPGQPVRVEDDRTRQVYFLVSSEDFGKLIESSLRQALQIGLDQADRSESEPWDMDTFLAEAHRRHAQTA